MPQEFNTTGYKLFVRYDYHHYRMLEGAIAGSPHSNIFNCLHSFQTQSYSRLWRGSVRAQRFISLLQHAFAIRVGAQHCVELGYNEYVQIESASVNRRSSPTTCTSKSRRSSVLHSDMQANLPDSCHKHVQFKTDSWCTQGQRRWHPHFKTRRDAKDFIWTHVSYTMTLEIILSKIRCASLLTRWSVLFSSESPVVGNENEKCKAHKDRRLSCKSAFDNRQTLKMKECLYTPDWLSTHDRSLKTNLTPLKNMQ
jgi:hypothetical protein